MSLPAKILTWTPVARLLADEILAAATRPTCVAIAGAQGSGKTTLARVLTDELKRSGLGAVACSLDDFYLTHAQREALARSVHPLLVTRGVPGTHDIELCLRTLDDVTRRPTPMPVFDKGLDDRIQRSRWPVAGPVQVVVIEGWCLGARPQTPGDLVTPINDLERAEDPDGRFRRYVNDALAQRYQDLFERFDKLVFLQVPDFDAVVAWRGQQELQIPQANRMTQRRLRRFVAHYERLTRWMIEDVPARADLTVVLNAAHGIDRSITKRAG
jgi:D-glycerate 3-kinase